LPIRNFNDSSKDKDTGGVLVVGKGVLIAYIISAVLLIIYGILLAVTSLSEASMPTVAMIITMVSIALASIYVSMRVRSKGWLNGAIVGLVYMIILFFISLIFGSGISFDKFILFRMFMGFVIGALAGVIGINLK
jgi:putative membrane protein (TIGR04086 family)